MIPWDVRYAIAVYHAHGWRAVPPHLLMAVQYVVHGGGCSSCAAVGR